MILIYGGTGYIGKHIVKELEKNKLEFVLSSKRIYNYTDIENDIKLYHPKFIISAAGYSTPTTIDHYESHKEELLLTNTTGNLILADLTSKYNIHLTLIMSGCIYQYKDYSDFNYYKLKFTEESKPNFSGSFYSKNRIETEQLLSNYNNLCILRLRMPISDNLHSKSLITKIIKYSTFEEYLSQEGLARTLPGIKTIKEGIDIYYKYYTPEQEKEFGILAIYIKLL